MDFGNAACRADKGYLQLCARAGHNVRSSKTLALARFIRLAEHASDASHGFRRDGRSWTLVMRGRAGATAHAARSIYDVRSGGAGFADADAETGGPFYVRLQWDGGLALDEPGVRWLPNSMATGLSITADDVELDSWTAT